MPEKIDTADVEARVNTVVEQYGSLLRDTIVRLCPKDLGIQFDDVEQEARMRLWRALQSERKILDLASYAYKIAVTTTIDAVRRVKARREEQLRQYDEQDEMGEAGRLVLIDSARSPEREAELQQAVQKVDEELPSRGV